MPHKNAPPPPEIVEVTESRVSCDGSGGALGHPRVWITIPPATGFVDCGYCDRRFVLRGDAASEH